MESKNQQTEKAINKIFMLRGEKIMVDEDVAELFGVPLKVFRQRVSGNLKRFPPDFRFIPTIDEWDDLQSQMKKSKQIGKNDIPAVFTETGIFMASGLIDTERAIQISIDIINQFFSLFK
jgi:hypothetical protein